MKMKKKQKSRISLILSKLDCANISDHSSPVIINSTKKDIDLYNSSCSSMNSSNVTSLKSELNDANVYKDDDIYISTKIGQNFSEKINMNGDDDFEYVVGQRIYLVASFNVKVFEKRDYVGIKSYFFDNCQFGYVFNNDNCYFFNPREDDSSCVYSRFDNSLKKLIFIGNNQVFFDPVIFPLIGKIQTIHYSSENENERIELQSYSFMNISKDDIVNKNKIKLSHFKEQQMMQFKSYLHYFLTRIRLLKNEKYIINKKRYSNYSGNSPYLYPISDINFRWKVVSMRDVEEESNFIICKTDEKYLHFNSSGKDIKTVNVLQSFQENTLNTDTDNIDYDHLDFSFLSSIIEKTDDFTRRYEKISRKMRHKYIKLKIEQILKRKEELSNNKIIAQNDSNILMSKLLKLSRQTKTLKKELYLNKEDNTKLRQEIKKVKNENIGLKLEINKIQKLIVQVSFLYQLKDISYDEFNFILKNFERFFFEKISAEKIIPITSKLKQLIKRYYKENESVSGMSPTTPKTITKNTKKKKKNNNVKLLLDSLSKT